MKTFFYSPTTNAFYRESLRARYVTAGTWPDDAAGVDDSVYTEFAANPAPAGQMRVVGADNVPVWGGIPAPTQSEVVAANTRKYNRLLRACTDAAFPLQSALALGIITPQQQTMLTELQNYAVALADTDLTVTPVIWPTPPASVKLPL